jgi:hypothetical protein
MKLELADHGRRKSSESRIIQTYINCGRFSCRNIVYLMYGKNLH